MNNTAEKVKKEIALENGFANTRDQIEYVIKANRDFTAAAAFQIDQTINDIIEAYKEELVNEIKESVNCTIDKI